MDLLYHFKARKLSMLIANRILLIVGLFAASLSVSHAEQARNALLRTNLGDIVVELDKERAPITVANFITYINEGYYNGTIFHRVIDGFMIHGGVFTAYMQKKPPTHSPIKNEAANKLRNDVGTIAMARTSDPHSATAQFFINVTNNDFLNFRSATARGYGYTVFGKVISGMDVVEKIRKTPTGSSGPFPKDVPRTTVVIESVSLILAAQPMNSPTMQ
jgi:cyclophilin family peptidyl-prolyl cis-trans isomerase